MPVKAGDAFVDFHGDFTSLQKGVAAQLTPLTSKFGKFGTAAVAGLAGIGVAAGAAGKALYDIGAQFDDAFDTIQTKTGASGKELDKLEQSFKNVVSSVPVDFGTAADAVAGLNQRLHITGKPLDRLAKQLSALSKITGEDINESVAATTRLFGDWSVKTKDQTDTLDALFRLTQETGIGFSDLERLMVQFGSPLRQLGFHFDEAAAMFSRFEREGVNMQTLLPGLRMALKNIAVPTDDLATMFKQLGINTRDPHEALLQIFDILSKDKISETDQTLLASSVFGGRAWADMKAAIEEGRFEFSDLIDVMKNGKDTIRGSERSTRDFSEQWQLFKNRVMVWLEPLATTVFKGIGDAMKNLNQLMKGKGGFADAIHSVANSLKDFWKQSAVFRAAVKFMADVAKREFAAIKQVFQAGLQVLRGIVKVISGVLTGNWGRAWDGVKDIFGGGVKFILGVLRGATAPVREIASRISGVLVKAFDNMKDRAGKIWFGLAKGIAKVAGAIASVVRSVVDVVRKVVHFIVNAINKAVTALGDLKDKVSPISLGNLPPNPITGGLIPGVPSIGDLFAQGGLAAVVPGVAPGDRHTLSLGGVPIGKVESREGIFVGNRNLMGAMAAANAAIPRDRHFASGGFAGMQPGIVGLVKAMLSKFGGSMSSGLRPGDPGFHGRGLAADIVPANWGGATAFANQIGPQLLEGIHQGPPGSNVSWDSGRQVSPSFWGSATWAEHVSHIHLAIAKALGALGGLGSASIGKFKIKGRGPFAGMTRAAAEHMRQVANRYIARHTGTGLGAGVPTGPIQQMARQMIGQIWGAGQWPPFNALEMSEAGWNPRAVNPSSGAAGLAQALPPSKYPPGAWPYQGLESAKLQLQWMMGYIKQRYGSPAGAWGFHQAHNWYGNGADFLTNGPQVIGVGERGRERVTITPGDGPPFEINVYVGRGSGAEMLDDTIDVRINDRRSLDRQLDRMHR